MISIESRYSFAQAKTWLLAFAFVTGNIVLPQLCHLLPAGGPTWLPIYFFTLIGGYAFGWRVGVLTAVGSPVINMVLFGMPAAAVLPAILLKSLLLAVAAGYAGMRFGRASILALMAVVAFYQVFGSLGEWALCGNLSLAVQDFRVGIPGMLVQIVACYVVLRGIGVRK